MITPMRQEDSEDHINTAWESLTCAFADYSAPEVIAPSLAEYVLGLSIAGRHEDAAVWMPVAQLYATLASARNTEVLQMVVSDIRDNGLPGT
jgi:hypothetical protein